MDATLTLASTETARMRLTTHTDYSLRALMYLAVRKQELATIADISQAYNISNNHLMKVVYELSQAGFIQTLRGRQGGIRLARAPEEINIGDVVRQTESDLNVAVCFVDADACSIQPSCVLQRALREALKAFLTVLDGYTLADLVRSRRRIATLLGLEEIADSRG
jgi:Rrf2 family nitric oxide-sensitive transcriptional repressor